MEISIHYSLPGTHHTLATHSLFRNGHLVRGHGAGNALHLDFRPHGCASARSWIDLPAAGSDAGLPLGCTPCRHGCSVTTDLRLFLLPRPPGGIEIPDPAKHGAIASSGG